MTQPLTRPTFEELDFTRPKPLALPSTLAGLLFTWATHADTRGDTAARTYWLEQLQEHLGMEQS